MVFSRMRVVVLAISLAGQLVAVPVRGETKPDRPAPTRCEPHCYNANYLFPATREVRNACLDPLATAALLPLTLVADIVLLPAGLLMGLFG